MSELLLKIGDSPTYKDGDILHAMTDEQILNHHAQVICNPRKESVTDRLLPNNGLSKAYFEACSEYRFLRLSDTKVRRFNLWLSTQEDLDMDVKEFLRRRKSFLTPERQPKKPIFGEVGAEVWYGGSLKTSNISTVWDTIESKTGLMRANHSVFPFDNSELSKYFIVPVASLTSQRASELTEQRLDDDGNMLEKRKHKVNYLSKLVLEQKTIDDMGKRNVVKPRPRTRKYDVDVIAEEKAWQP